LGTITPLATVTVRTQISGIMQKIAFTEGQLVHQGDCSRRSIRAPTRRPATDAGQSAPRSGAAGGRQTGPEALRRAVKEDSIAVQQLDTQKALVDQYIGTIESDEGSSTPPK
jgi:membrane fusion protein, multidrug efflux system